MHTNRLIHESSPYLLEHAHNPVDWHPWGEEALAKAQRENKPLLISIGYAACHWCHVMEHESFSNEEIAHAMNNHFVCIKVDREERPDIDKIYMDAVQLITQRGGWPLNAFALPDGKPFYGGTYFQPEQWVHLLKQITLLYETRHQDVIQQANNLTLHIQTNDMVLIDEPAATTRFKEIFHNELFINWLSIIDFEKGGFHGAPKFVLPVAWEFLMQYHAITKNKVALQAVEKTLTAIAKGGINDLLGGGFARYSVDDSWHVPHFEKMLYDNAQLMTLYAQAIQLTHNEYYTDTISQIDTFIKKELTAPEGLFYSSINADSEGVEGKFYVWTFNEVLQAVDAHLIPAVTAYFSITPKGNWEDGLNVLKCDIDNKTLATQLNMTTEELDNQIATARHQMLNFRAKRTRPSTDTKRLTSWNALMIKGYIDAFMATGNNSYLEQAETAASYINQHLIQADGSVIHNFNLDKVSIDGFLEDYAFTARAFIALYQVTLKSHWLHRAHQITTYASEHFKNDESPMFYFTHNRSQDLIARKTEITDNVTPSSNSVMAEVLLLLGIYFDNSQWIRHAEAMVAVVTTQAIKNGPYYGNWNRVMGLIAHDLTQIIVTGSQAVETIQAIQRQYHPTALFAGGNDTTIPLLANKQSETTKIYVCKGQTCYAPVTYIEDARPLFTTE